jgi:hypothetical protein
MANFASVIKYFPTPKEGFITTLGSSVLSGAVTIPLNSTSGLTNGDVFVGLIEPGLTNQQCFTGTVDTAGNQITGVVYTTGTNVAHSAGVTIVDYVTSTTVGMISKGVLKHANQDGSLTNAAVKAALGITADPTGSWNLLDGGAPTVSSVTANGNRSYTINFASDYSTTLSPGMRLKTTRTVAAPTQCTDLESGSSQYFSKTSPTGLSFTTTYTCSAWIKLESYGATSGIIARRNADTEGWAFEIGSDGRLYLSALRIAANNKVGATYQSVPLNKWVHVAASMDVTVAGDASTLMYIDGVLVPSAVTTTGTCTALVQGTTALVVGAGKSAGTSPFDGKIAQAAVYSAVLSAATIRAAANQTLTGSETSLVSAYSFNGVITDLNTSNANNLTAIASAVATEADSPFGGQADGTESSTLDYAIITKIATTAVTVQVPEGCTIPTTGGISGVSYATVKTPYGFPGQRGKWQISSISLTNQAQLTPTSATWYNVGSHQLSVPVGSWATTIEGNISAGESGGTLITASATLSKANNTQDNLLFTSTFTVNAGAGAAANVNIGGGYSKTVDVETSAIQVYYLNIMSTSLTPPTLDLNSPNAIIQVTNAYL